MLRRVVCVPTYMMLTCAYMWHRSLLQVAVHAAVCDKPRVVHYADDANDCCRGIAEFMSTTFLQTWLPRVELLVLPPLLLLLLRNMISLHLLLLMPTLLLQLPLRPREQLLVQRLLLRQHKNLQLPQMILQSATVSATRADNHSHHNIYRRTDGYPAFKSDNS